MVLASGLVPVEILSQRHSGRVVLFLPRRTQWPDVINLKTQPFHLGKSMQFFRIVQVFRDVEVFQWRPSIFSRHIKIEYSVMATSSAEHHQRSVVFLDWVSRVARHLGCANVYEIGMMS